MHHKRKRPKNQRAGCLMCKPHKHQASKDSFESQTMQEREALIADQELEFEFGEGPTAAPRRKEKRTFILEARYTRGPNRFFHPSRQSWFKHSAYATARARDEALRSLSKKNDTFKKYYGVEYRIPEEK